MYAFMSEHPELMTESNEEGVKKVLEGKGDYAFLMESSAIDYEKEQHCELAQIGPLLDNKNYGIAMRKGNYDRENRGFVAKKEKVQVLINPSLQKFYRK